MGNDTKPDTKGVDGITKLVASLDTPNRVTEEVFRTTALGSVTTAIGDSFYGLNHRQQPKAISINKDFYGLTFFTRPRLNLTTENLRYAAPGQSRVLAPLLTERSDSIQRIIRCLLDPDLAKRDGVGGPIASPFVDPQQAFIPILTNNLLSIAGWPDVIAPTFTSAEGVYKESFSMVDGLTQNYGTYDITANFRNIPGDPINLLFFAWITYASLVYQGMMVPYPDMIINNEIDYNTRIYRLVLDSTKTRVQKIAACGASFPWNSQLGASFNYEADRPINNGNDQITINFRCMGALYQDDILVYEFNRTVGMFNPSMAEQQFSRRQIDRDNWEWTNPYNTKVPLEALMIFNNRGYPRIDPITYNLDWWVSNQDFQQLWPVYERNKDDDALVATRR